MARTEVHAVVDKRGDLQKMTAFALNEWDSKLSGGVEWRQKIDAQRAEYPGEMKPLRCLPARGANEVQEPALPAMEGGSEAAARHASGCRRNEEQGTEYFLFSFAFDRVTLSEFRAVACCASQLRILLLFTYRTHPLVR